MTQFQYVTGNSPSRWHLNDQDARQLAHVIVLEPATMPNLTNQERAELFANPLHVKTLMLQLFGLPVEWTDYPETALA